MGSYRLAVLNLDPALIMAMWAAGLSIAAAVVVWWRIVGTGYRWLAAGTSAGFGIVAAVSGGGLPAWIGAASAALAVFVPPAGATGLLGLAGVAHLGSIATNGPIVLSLLGAASLGGITSEMMLGHWFLIDPRLPRWSLHRLAAVGGSAAALDAIALILHGADLSSVSGIAFISLATTTVLLLVGVWFSLKEPSYTGVMAATGLSYLATLTAVGAVVAGRADVSNIGGFMF